MSVNESAYPMELYDIVMRLTGAIQPVGETHADYKRMFNLIEFAALTDRMIQELTKCAQNATRHEMSMRDAGQYAKAFLDNLESELKERRE